MVEPRESHSLDPSNNAHHDLGLTLPPGSQPQLAVPTDDQEDVDDLASVFGMDDDFDPFTDFGKLVQHKDQTNLSKKRTSDVAFEGDIEVSPNKRFVQEEQKASVAVDTTVQPSDLHTHTSNHVSIPPVSSPEHLAALDIPAPISSTIQKALHPESLARIAAVEAFAQGKSEYISPYAQVGYNPSAPNLHSNGGETDSNEALQSRLNSSHRRLDVVMAERNKYRDALLKFEQVDPETGMLGIQKLETENMRLRRMASNHRYQMDKLKAEVEQWKEKYTQLATTHNCLIRDYQTLQATTCSGGTTVQAPTGAAFTPDRDNRKGSYELSSQTLNMSPAAYGGSHPNPSGINSSGPSPASPNSISSPSDTFHTAPANRVQSGADTCSPPSLPEDHLTDLPLLQSEGLSSDFLTPLSVQSPPGEPTTMATNYANSTSSRRQGYVPPIAREQAASFLQRAGMPLDMPTTTAAANMPAAHHPVAAHHATGATMITPPTSSPVAAVTPAAIMKATATTNPGAAATTEPAVSTLTVPPKDVVVIDLTSDSDIEVSPQGSTSQSSAPLTKESSPLTEFRRRVCGKNLFWLHETNSSTADAAVAEAICQGLNSRKRKRELGDAFVGATWDECYGHVQAQKVLSSGSPYFVRSGSVLLTWFLYLARSLGVGRPEPSHRHSLLRRREGRHSSPLQRHRR